jgi:hypothetical protein
LEQNADFLSSKKVNKINSMHEFQCISPRYCKQLLTTMTLLFAVEYCGAASPAGRMDTGDAG